MNIRLILVRHGNTFEKEQIPVQVGCKTDMPLTQEGKNQAKIMSDYLSTHDIKPDVVYSGSLKRQLESGQIIAAEQNTVFIANEPALNEIDYGAWEGLTAEEITSKWPLDHKRWVESRKWASGIFKGSEKHHVDAIEQWLNELRQHHLSDHTILAVTSNGIIQFFRKDHKENDKVKTGHFCEITLTSDDLIVQRWNINPNLS